MTIDTIFLVCLLRVCDGSETDNAYNVYRKLYIHVNLVYNLFIAFQSTDFRFMNNFVMHVYQKFAIL